MNEMTRISSAANEFSARFTTAEFLDMADMGAFGDWKVELVEGELHRMPPPGNSHSSLQVSIITGLASVATKTLVRGETGIHLGNDTMLGCDAALLREPVKGRQRLSAGAFLLVVEIAETTLDRDMGMKRRKYAEAGVAIYWVVDSSRRVTHVHTEPAEGDYAEIHTVRFGQPIAVPGTDAAITLD